LGGKEKQHDLFTNWFQVSACVMQGTGGGGKGTDKRGVKSDGKKGKKTGKAPLGKRKRGSIRLKIRGVIFRDLICFAGRGEGGVKMRSQPLWDYQMKKDRKKNNS